MTAATYTLTDTGTLLHRNLLHALRYPAMSLSSLLMPLIFLLLFRYAFGSTLGAGIGGSYINYLAPGMLIMTATSSMVSTAVSVCTDMSEGIVDRLRTMSISRFALLAGHVVGNWIQALLAMAMGLSAKAPEGASSLPMPVILLPFLGSGFVPAASMSPGLRQFAEYQPFTPVTETLRGLLLGTHIGTDWIQAVGWCVALTVAGYLGSRRLFNRRAEL
jgi:ABC-2 type transport system permease protein